MASTAFTELLHHLRRAVAEADGDLSDAELLDRVVGRRDQAALGVIVRRHGPMVWQVCRRLLQHHHDAEDAFQATFLVLVRRAASVRPGNHLARWLFGVARQTSRYARANIALRRHREKQVHAMIEPAAVPAATDERHALLECELNRLPQRYRAAIVGCAMEGRSRQELAQQLGVPEGTVSGWLSRGKKLLASRLAKRLVRHGVASGGAVLVVPESAQAALPPDVLACAIAAVSEAAGGPIAGPGVISARAIQLMEGVLRTMLLKKLQGFMAAFVLVALCTAGAVAQWCSAMSTTEPAGQAPNAAAQAAPGETAKPVRIDDAGVQQLYYGDGDLVASVNVRWHVVDIKTENGPGKALLAESMLQIWDAKTAKLRQLAAQEKGVYFSALAVAAGRKRAVLVANHISQDGPPTPSEIRLLNPQTWEVERTVEAADLKLEGGEWVGCAALSPDGKSLALGGSSQRTKDGVFVEIWDLAEKKLRGGTTRQKAVEAKPQAFPDPADIKRGFLTTLTFSPDGKWVAAGDDSGKVRLYDAATGKVKHTLQEESATQIFKLAFSPDGRRLATTTSIEYTEGKPVAADRAVHLWNTATGKLERRLQRDNHTFFVVAFSPDGKRIASAGALRQDTQLGRPVVALWDAQTGELVQMVPHGLTNPEQHVSALAFAPDGKTLAIAGTIAGDLKTNEGKVSSQISFVAVP
jgi:RNA polymerase sigma factor (sigma-70 family)